MLVTFFLNIYTLILCHRKTKTLGLNLVRLKVCNLPPFRADTFFPQLSWGIKYLTLNIYFQLRFTLCCEATSLTD